MEGSFVLQGTFFFEGGAEKAEKAEAQRRQRRGGRGAKSEEL